MEQATNKKEVVYKKAKLGKRMLAYFIDIGLLLMSALIMLSVINIPITHSSWYKSKENELTEIRNETGLYVGGINIVDYLTDNNEYPSYEEKKNELSTRIDNFYKNTTYFNDLNKIQNDYENRKSNAKKDGVNLFVHPGSETCTEPDCADSTKSPWCRKNELSNRLTSQFQRRQFCFELDALVVVEVDVVINELTRLFKGCNLLAVDALRFENGEKVFSQSVVVRISTS